MKISIPSITPSAASRGLYDRILSKFPSECVTFCFAYGSGVLKQTNNEPKRNMLDFIISVKNAEKWHELNLKMNPSHYSFLSLFGSKALAKIQTNIPSRMYFNSMIPIKNENVVIKYGVVTENDLVADLLDWNYLYVAGRLHKPVVVVKKTNSENLLAALQLNLQSAVHASLLLLPENFSEMQFYKTITSLSYIGDFRMKFGEDKNKVSNIVSGGLQNFRSLYAPIFKMMEEYVEMPTGSSLLIEGDRYCSQDVSPSARHFHLNHLPRKPQRQLVQFWNKGSRNRQDTEDVLRAMAFDQDCGEVVQSILSDIVWDSSIKQSLKGILTAGIFTSVLYSSKKIGKMLNVRKMLSAEEISDGSCNEKVPSDSGSAECDTNFFGPALPPNLLKSFSLESSKKETVYGPMLPDHLSEKEKEESTGATLPVSEEILIGPEIPEHLKDKQALLKVDDKPIVNSDEEDDFGPSTSLMAGEDATKCKFLNTQNFNEQARQDVSESRVQRETWMTELPKKKGANFGLFPRQFKTRVLTDKETDASVWTDTPADKKNKDGHKKSKDHKEVLQMKRLKERDKEMEKLVKKAAKKLKKKQQSLLEMHTESMKKKKKIERKKREMEGKTTAERRPFDRNVDLQIRKVNEDQKRAFLSKSHFLNDRFASGESKFL